MGLPQILVNSQFYCFGEQICRRNRLLIRGIDRFYSRYDKLAKSSFSHKDSWTKSIKWHYKREVFSEFSNLNSWHPCIFWWWPDSNEDWDDFVLPSAQGLKQKIAEIEPFRVHGFAEKKIRKKAKNSWSVWGEKFAIWHSFDYRCLKW